MLRLLTSIRALFVGDAQLYRNYLALSESHRVLCAKLREVLTKQIELEKRLAERD